MEYASLGRVLISFAAVVALMFLLSWLVRKFGLEKRIRMPESPKGRLQLVDQLFIGPRHRLVLIQRDDMCHLLLIGVEKETLLETFPAHAKPDEIPR